MDLAHHVAELEEQGFTILERVIEDEVVDALMADVHRLEALLDRTPDNTRFEGNRTTRTYNLLAHGEVWQQVPVRPEVCTLIESQLGAKFLVSSLASISLAPGETAQAIHADDQIQIAHRFTEQPGRNLSELERFAVTTAFGEMHSFQR